MASRTTIKDKNNDIVATTTLSSKFSATIARGNASPHSRTQNDTHHQPHTEITHCTNIYKQNQTQETEHIPNKQLLFGIKC